MNSRIRKIYTILFVTILILAPFNEVLAQERLELPIEVNPLVKELELAPGSVAEESLNIKNKKEKPLSIKITYKDFDSTIDGSVKLLESGKGQYSLGNYIEFSPQFFKLEPGEEREIEYTIDLPNNADRPHWGTIIITPEITDSQENGTSDQEKEQVKFKVKFKYSYRHVIIQRSTDSPPPRGRMANLTITGTGKGEDGKATLEATFSNTGKAITKCQGYVEIFDDKGQKIKRYDFVQDRFVFPESKRTFTQSLSDLDLKAGEYLAVAIIDFGGKNVVGGRSRFKIPSGTS